MKAKLFTLDKNYLLKEAQMQVKEKLLTELVRKVQKTYLREHNPLGLIDDTIRSIQSCRHPETGFLDKYYFELAGIYRFKYGENQLEFMFDGGSHRDKYIKDWIRTFHRWVSDFCRQIHFIRTVLEGSVLSPSPETRLHVEVRLKLFLEQYFGLRIYKYHGIRKIQAA